MRGRRASISTPLAGSSPGWSRFLSGFFILAVCSPLVRQAWVEDEVPGDSRAEFRKLADKPAWPEGRAALGSYPREFEAWYGDHFGFRANLLRWHNGLKWIGLGTSPAQSMIQGRDGWMFTTDSRSIEMYRGAIPFTRRELEDWCWSLESRRDRLAQRGIKYVFAIGPSKWEIYPEKMPARFGRVGPSRLEQLTTYLRQHSTVRVVDLRPVLLEAKKADGKDDLAYYPLGTHWTERGALAAYERLGRELDEALASYHGQTAADFELVASDAPGDSWARRMYLEDVLVQKSVKCRPKAPRQAQPQAVTGAPPRTLRTLHPNQDLPRGVLLHDSFSEQIRHWLAEGFSYFSAYWRYEFDEERILGEEPDVVIQMWVGRALEFMPATFMLQESPAVLRELFMRSGHSILQVNSEHVGTAEASGLWRLPPPGEHAGGRVLVHLRLRSKRKGSLVFLQEGAAGAGGGRRGLALVGLNAGMNDLYALLDGWRPDGQLLLGPSVPLAEGSLALVDLEIREVDR